MMEGQTEMSKIQSQMLDTHLKCSTIYGNHKCIVGRSKAAYLTSYSIVQNVEE